jgi:hypothetical protein
MDDCEVETLFFILANIRYSLTLLKYSSFFFFQKASIILKKDWKIIIFHILYDDFKLLVIS